jgi:hypothetical protein
MFSTELLEVWFDCCVNNRRNSYKGQRVFTDTLIKQYPELIDVCNQAGRTAAFYYRSDYNYIDMLTEERLNIKDVYGKMPLDFMILNHHASYETLTNVIQRGAKMSTTYTRLIISKLFNYNLHGLTVCLVSFGFLDTNVEYNSMPLLFRMIPIDHTNSLKLIELGANPHIIECNGKNIFDYLNVNNKMTKDTIVLLRHLVDVGVIINLYQIRHIANNNADLILDILYSFDPYYHHSS